MDVQLPNGQVITGVPDGITREQLAAKLSKNGMDVPDAWLEHPSDKEHTSDEYAPSDEAQYIKNTARYGKEYADKYRATTAYNNAPERKKEDAEKQRQTARSETLQAVENEKRKRAEEDETIGDKLYGLAGAGLHTIAAPFTGYAAGVAEMFGQDKAAQKIDEAQRSILQNNPAGQRYAEAVGSAVNASGIQGLAPEVGTAGRLGLSSREAAPVAQAAKSAERATEFTERNAPRPVSQQAAMDAAQHGYKVAPSNAAPSTAGRALEVTAGGTKKVASEMTHGNQEVTNAGAREDLGLPPKTPLTEERLDTYRSMQVDKGYKPLYKVKDPVTITDEARAKLDATMQNLEVHLPERHKAYIEKQLAKDDGAYTTQKAVDLIQGFRGKAKAYAKSSDVDLRETAKVYRAAADAVEESMEAALVNSKDPQARAALPGYQAARKNIAKSFSVEEALDGKGNVDARILARQKDRGVPLEGKLKAAADFATTFKDEAALPSDAISAKSLKDTILHGAQTAVLKSSYGQRKLAGVPEAEKPAATAPKPEMKLEEGPYTGGSAFTPKPPETRGLLELTPKGDEQTVPRDMSGTLRERHDVPTIDFPLRQEVLQQPEVQKAVQAFQQKDANLQRYIDNAINPKVREKAAERQAKLREGFARYMKRYGVDSPQKAQGINTPLYQSGQGTALPIQQTHTPGGPPQ